MYVKMLTRDLGRVKHNIINIVLTLPSLYQPIMAVEHDAINDTPPQHFFFIPYVFKGF